MELLVSVTRFLNRVLIWTAGLFMAAMVLLTCTNIVFRLADAPLHGTYELMGYFGSVVTAFALGYTQSKKGHVAVDILFLRFPRRTQKVLESINCLLLLAFFSVVAWQIAKYGMTLLETGEVTETLRIVYYPFTFAVSLGCAALVLVFLTQFLQRLFLTKEIGD